MAREELELLTDTRDFTTLIHVILIHESSERLEPSIESDLGMRFAICSLTWPFTILLASNTVSSVRTDH